MMRALFTIVVISAGFVGCDSKQTGPVSESAVKKIQSEYDAALADATNGIPCATDFARLFPGAASYLSYYIGLAGPSSLVMENLLFDRYQLIMKVPVTFDASRRKVSTFGEPEFLLLEIWQVTVERRVGRGPDGNPVTVENLRPGRSGDRSLRFGAVEWKKVVAARGDFSVIGFAVLTNSPAPGFDDLRKNWEMRMRKQP
jgi:hypothetical protein